MLLWAFSIANVVALVFKQDPSTLFKNEDIGAYKKEGEKKSIIFSQEEWGGELNASNGTTPMTV